MKKPYAFIVEDDEFLSEIFAKTLQTDFEIEVIGDGSTALMRLAQFAPDLVVLDLNLPGLSGKDILADIRSNPALARVRVILCTADARQAEFLQEQADVVMLKPISTQQLRGIATRLSLGANTTR